MMDAQWHDAPFDLLGRFLRVGVVRLALPARITTWDAATLDILGLAQEVIEPGFDAFVERVHPDDQAALREAEGRLAQGPGSYRQRARYIRPDGRLCHLNLMYEARAAADGEGLDVACLLIDETESVETWRAQWERENLVGRALSVAGISLWQLDLATQRISLDELGRKVLGRERPPGGMPLAELRDTLHPDDRRIVEEAGEEAMRVDRVVEAVARYRDAKGRYRHLLTRRFRHRDAQGRTVGVMGLSIDISELVAERERSLSLLERMQLVAETVGVGFWWRDIDAGVFGWDEQMYRMHHRDPVLGPPSLDEWIGRHVHPEDRGWMAARQEAHYGSWTPASDVVFRTVVADGSVRWIQAWTRHLLRDGHRVSLGIHVDITERKRADQRAEVERQRDQFAIEAAGIGMWERDMNGTPLYWSPAMYRLRGLDADDPRSIQEVIDATMQPEADAEGHRRVVHSLRTGEPFGYEFEVIWPDGTRRWLASSGRAVRDATGKPVTVAGVNVDITERRMAEHLARERDRAQQASAAKSELMARVSHELRTPMNAVLGFADLMAQDDLAPLAPAQDERLTRIRSAGTHLLGLIDDLLDLSRADQGDRSTTPLADAESAAVSAAGERPADTGKLRVLYIEDNPVNELLVREMLALRPAVSLASAPDGLSGIALALADPPHLILLDLQLPDMSGIEVLRRLRREPALAICRIVALSANAMPDDVASALSAGFSEYWTKPLNLQRFLADMDALLAAHVAG
jgi:PAS domain S-box-containing protein